MARARKINGKNGITFQLIAYTGYDANGKQLTKTKTWKPEGLTDKQAEKQAIVEAELYEKAVNNGAAAFDGKIRFADYAAVWLDNAQIAPKTRERYIVLLRRINEAIGHKRLENLQAHHLEAFYKNLAEDGIKNNGQFAISDRLVHIIGDKKLSRGQLAKVAGVALATVSHATSGKPR
ncbi:MAG: hypothetical protein FWF81_03725 [Defluviitaleaceae bacterium]|nr:hypothetical protein [Defluviitaleaceae bacterium]